MIVECPYCETKVQGTFIGECAFLDPDSFPTKVVLVCCPICRSPLLGGQDLVQTGPEEHDWRGTARLWPRPDESIDWSIPDIVRHSLEEARKCFKARAYSACAVMCGRALEGVCNKYNAKNKMLAGGLKELLEQGVIDKRLFEWGEVLRKHRNIGAHASADSIPKEDAKDLLDFVNAICEYVFVLSDKFEKFLERTEARKKLS